LLAIFSPKLSSLFDYIVAVTVVIMVFTQDNCFYAYHIQDIFYFFIFHTSNIEIRYDKKLFLDEVYKYLQYNN